MTLHAPAPGVSRLPATAARRWAAWLSGPNTAAAEIVRALGYGSVADVRQGKYFELDLDTAEAAHAKALAAEVADRLLANPVIESYRIEVE